MRTESMEKSKAVLKDAEKCKAAKAIGGGSYIIWKERVVVQNMSDRYNATADPKTKMNQQTHFEAFGLKSLP